MTLVKEPLGAHMSYTKLTVPELQVKCKQCSISTEGMQLCTILYIYNNDHITVMFWCQFQLASKTNGLFENASRFV